MAIVRMLHRKEETASCRGLKKAVEYAMNPDKTDSMKWTGGNAGATPQEVYDRMMETKTAYEKLDGRQCYHFIVSFKPGECGKETAFKVAQDFCQRYLGDRFEYCFGVHTDKKHMHIHIVFNSVSIVTGLKYHYANGDWAKVIQPIMDEVAQSYGLSKLEYDKGKKVGKGYGNWRKEKEEQAGTAHKNHSEEIRKDIDAAIPQAGSYEEFLGILSGKYQVRTGYSAKRDCEYFAVKSEDMERARRNYLLGPEYTVERIRERIRLEKVAPLPEDEGIPVDWSMPKPENVESSHPEGDMLPDVPLPEDEEIPVDWSMPEPEDVENSQPEEDMLPDVPLPEDEEIPVDWSMPEPEDAESSQPEGDMQPDVPLPEDEEIPVDWSMPEPEDAESSQPEGDMLPDVPLPGADRDPETVPGGWIWYGKPFVSLRRELIVLTLRRGRYPTATDPSVRKYLYHYWQVKNLEKRLAGGNTRGISRQVDQRLADLYYMLTHTGHGRSSLAEQREILEEERKEMREIRHEIRTSIGQTDWEILRRYEELQKALASDPDAADAGKWRKEMGEIEEVRSISDMRKEYEEKLSQLRGLEREEKELSGELDTIRRIQDI